MLKNNNSTQTFIFVTSMNSLNSMAEKTNIRRTCNPFLSMYLDLPFPFFLLSRQQRELPSRNRTTFRLSNYHDTESN